jgi:hypothetical protein
VREEGVNGFLKFKEYDLETKPIKIVKGQGIAKLLVESNYRVLDLNTLSTKYHSSRVQRG